MALTGVAEVLKGRQIMRGMEDIVRYEDMSVMFFEKGGVLSCRSLLNSSLIL